MARLPRRVALPSRAAAKDAGAGRLWCQPRGGPVELKAGLEGGTLECKAH